MVTWLLVNKPEQIKQLSVVYDSKYDFSIKKKYKAFQYDIASLVGESKNSNYLDSHQQAYLYLRSFVKVAVKDETEEGRCSFHVTLPVQSFCCQVLNNWK